MSSMCSEVTGYEEEVDSGQRRMKHWLGVNGH